MRHAIETREFHDTYATGPTPLEGELSPEAKARRARSDGRDFGRLVGWIVIAGCALAAYPMLAWLVGVIT